MGFTAVSGIDFTLPSAPPLTQPPLSLPELAIKLIDTEGLVERLRVANEKAASAAEQLADLMGGDEERDQAGQADSEEDAARAIAQLESEYKQLSNFATDLAAQVADLSRWEHGLVYLPELSNDSDVVSVFVPDSGDPITDGPLKPAADNQAPAEAPFYWYDPFVAVALDQRSAFGWPNTDFTSRALRAQRALVGHEAWQVEQEFWTGEQIPTNYHLTASPDTPTTSPHRTIDAWPAPTAPTGTIMGTAYSLSQSMAALDQAIADSDAGTGMIHASCYVMQEWMKLYPFIRDPDGKVYTVNHNLLVPGFGYSGVGPDTAARTVADGVTTADSLNFSSASADFTAADIGRELQDATGDYIAPGTYIVSITSSTEVVMSQLPITDGTDLTITIPGQGGRATGSPQQWAYATEQVYTLRGDLVTYPFDLREGSPLLPVDNAVAVRAERTWGCLTNRLLRAAILIDTTES